MDTTDKEINKFAEEEFPQIEKKLSNWVYFLSIDPGMLNLGWVMGRYKCNQETKEIDVELHKEKMKSEYVMDFEGLVVENIEMSLKRWIYKLNLTKEQLESFVVFMEKQYILAFDNKNPKLWKIVLKLQLVQACLYSLLDAMGILTILISSSDYKKKLGLNTKNRNQNKKKAIEFTKTLLPENQHKFIADNHHVCDAINQAYFKIKTSHEETFGVPEYKLNLKIVENF